MQALNQKEVILMLSQHFWMGDTSFLDWIPLIGQIYVSSACKIKYKSYQHYYETIAIFLFYGFLSSRILYYIMYFKELMFVLLLLVGSSWTKDDEWIKDFISLVEMGFHTKLHPLTVKLPGKLKYIYLFIYIYIYIYFIYLFYFI